MVQLQNKMRHSTTASYLLVLHCTQFVSSSSQRIFTEVSSVVNVPVQHTTPASFLLRVSFGLLSLREPYVYGRHEREHLVNSAGRSNTVSRGSTGTYSMVVTKAYQAAEPSVAWRAFSIIAHTMYKYCVRKQRAYDVHWYFTSYTCTYEYLDGCKRVALLVCCEWIGVHYACACCTSNLPGTLHDSGQKISSYLYCNTQKRPYHAHKLMINNCARPIRQELSLHRKVTAPHLQSCRSV